MEKILTEIICAQCDKALVESEQYISKEYGGKVSDDELRLLAEKLIYKKAVRDTICSLRYFNLL